MVLGSPRRTVRNKYLVFIGTIEYKHRVLVINTEPAPYIQDKQHLMDDQVPIDCASHDCLTHDSFVGCHELEEVDQRDVENALVKDIDDIKGMISDTVRAEIVRVVNDSVNLMPLFQKFIAVALKP